MVFTTGRFKLSLALFFVLVFLNSFSIVITSLGEERAGLLLFFYTDRSKAVLLLWFLNVLAVCVYTLVHLLC